MTVCWLSISWLWEGAVHFLASSQATPPRAEASSPTPLHTTPAPTNHAAGSSVCCLKTLLASASNTGMIQCKEKGPKERIRKEESHVDVPTRVGNHSRGNGACGTSSVPERDLGHAVA